MKTREQIITDMCYTMRHDYGLSKSQQADPFSAGMTEDERKALWRQMAQIFDNNIAPHMEFQQGRAAAEIGRDDMAQDGILRMAHEADCLDPQHYGSIWMDKLGRFAALVTAAERQRRAQITREFDRDAPEHQLRRVYRKTY